MYEKKNQLAFSFWYRTLWSRKYATTARPPLSELLCFIK